MTMTSDSTTAENLIPLAAAAVALGYTPASAYVIVSQGRFPVPIHKKGRYSMVVRGDVLAEMKRRPHLTQDQFAAVASAHEAMQDGVSLSPAMDLAVRLLAASKWVTVSEAALLLGIAPKVINARHAAGTLPFALEPDPDSKRGGRRASSLEVAAYLASQEPSWPSAEEFAAVPSLDLSEVKRALGDEAPAGANDPVTQAFLASRETITLADYALMLGISQDALKRRSQRGQVETVEDPSATGTQRRTKRIRSDYAAAHLQEGRQTS